MYSANLIQEKYFRGSSIDELVAGYVTQTGKLTPFFFQHDQVTSVSAETTPNGGTQATLAYFAFGETQATTGIPISRLQYTGRENDGNGCYQYRARTYCPSIGIFLSEDPMKFAAGANFYAYVGNNPLNANDPDGLEAVINRSGNNFDITFRNVNVLVQPPLNPAIAAGMMRNVEKVWSGSFPPYQAQTSVQYNMVTRFPTGTDPSRINVTIQPGSGTSSSQAGGFYGNPANITLFAKTYSNTPAHEFGHNLGLVHPAINAALPAVGNNVVRGSNIMMYPPPGQPDTRRPDASNFNQIIQNSILGDGPRIGGGAQYDLAPESGNSWLFGGASGGFLLYPNKSNTNMTRSVYSK